MGYGVQVRVDPDVLVTGARRLGTAAATLETLADRLRTLCAGTGAAVGDAGLSVLLTETGLEAARAVGEGASVARALGTGTALAGEGYRRLELALRTQWADGPW